MDNNELKVVGDKELQQAQPLLDLARRLASEIKDDTTYVAAGELLSKVKQVRKNVAALLDPFVNRSYKKWKEDGAERDKYDKPLAEAIDVLNKPLADYNAKKERERQAEQKRIDAELKKQADDAALALAQQLHSDGQEAQAEGVLNHPAPPPAVIVPKSTPQVTGMRFQDFWSAEVTDFMVLVRAVAAGTVPSTALLPNDTFLGGRARMDKKDFSIPGVKAICASKPINR